MKNPPFLLNLPSEITTEILLRLPIRTIVLCKCVCKEFLKILSSSEFAKSHVSRSTPGIIVSLTQVNESMCRVLEFEDKLGLQRHDLRHKLVTKFDPTEFIGSPATSIMMHNSVNGLLFLRVYANRLDALYICNPITREYILLPNPDGNALYDNHNYGFGVSSLSGQYKVVIISYRIRVSIKTGSRLRNIEVKCSVYTLGSGSWRSVEHGEPYQYNICWDCVLLNGNLHWYVRDVNGSQLISCFDLEKEVFHPFPLPSTDYLSYDTSLAALEDCLWFCDNYLNGNIIVWVMEEYGVKESWTKKFFIRNFPCSIFEPFERDVPIKAFKDGHILFFRENTCMFYYCTKTGTASEAVLFEWERKGMFQATWHSSSFLALERKGMLQATWHSSSFLALKSFATENVISF